MATTHIIHSRPIHIVRKEPAHGEPGGNGDDAVDHEGHARGGTGEEAEDSVDGTW